MRRTARRCRGTPLRKATARPLIVAEKIALSGLAATRDVHKIALGCGEKAKPPIDAWFWCMVAREPAWHAHANLSDREAEARRRAARRRALSQSLWPTFLDVGPPCQNRDVVEPRRLRFVATKSRRAHAARPIICGIEIARSFCCAANSGRNYPAENREQAENWLLASQLRSKWGGCEEWVVALFRRRMVFLSKRRGGPRSG